MGTVSKPPRIEPRDPQQRISNYPDEQEQTANFGVFLFLVSFFFRRGIAEMLAAISISKASSSQLYFRGDDKPTPSPTIHG